MQNTMRNFWQRRILYSHRAAPYLLILLASLNLTNALAETITISKGKGILWEGLPFNLSRYGAMNTKESWPHYGLLSISSSNRLCMGNSQLTTIAGYPAIRIAPGLGLVPKAQGLVDYYIPSNGNFSVQLSGTLGLPGTKGTLSNGSKVTSSSGYSWCLAPKNSYDAEYYRSGMTRTVTITGTWVLVGDGTQTTAEVTLPTMYAASFSQDEFGSLSNTILPANITLRVSTLECTVNTPSSISFGPVGRDLQAGAELGVVSNPLLTTCGQPSDQIDANINLQFRSLTGLYQTTPSRLALREGGGYITGEIDNGVTGSGKCTATSGLPFDNSLLKIGRITQQQSSLNLTNQVIWRLCSGGKDLPIGNVSAAAEMLVTFN